MTEFSISDLTLIAYGKKVDSSVKWPVFKLRFYVLCKVVKTHHPLYELTSR